MKVTKIRWMRIEGLDEHGFGGQPRVSGVLIVRVDTDEGIYGLGEVQDFLGVRDAIDNIREVLIGADPLAVQPFVTAMLYGRMPHSKMSIDHSMSPTATAVGPVVWAVSGVEMALCDLAGKAFNTPVYNLLGGKYRDRILIYADRSCPVNIADLDQWRELARAARDDGFRVIKFDIDVTAFDYTDDEWNRAIPLRQLNKIVERLTAVRAAVGWDVELTVDGHMHYDVRDSIRLANALADLKLMWLEDPTPIINPDALARVRDKSPIAICAGEMFITEQFRLFIDRGALDIVHPDVLFSGGLHETKKIADYADQHYIPLALHNNGGALATIAAAHVAASSRNFLGLECHFLGSKFLEDFIDRGAPLFDNGHVCLTDSPGLGLELNIAVCKKHMVAGELLV